MAFGRQLITEEAIKDSATNRVPAGTILLVTRTSVGKVAIAQSDLCFSQDITAITPDPERLYAGYLVHFLPANQGHFEKRVRGATIKGITREVVADLPIPVPPLPEQRRIAEILDRANALRVNRLAAITQLDSFTQSIFLDVFGDPVTNPMQWPLGRIGDLLASAVYGTSRKAGASGALPILRMGNITISGEIDLCDLKRIDLPMAEMDKHTVRRGDVLFNRTNSPQLVGKSAVVRSDEPMAYAGYLVRLRCTGGASPEFLGAFLNLSSTKVRLRAMCKAIVGMANIIAREVQAISLPVPPHHLQMEFEKKVAAAGDVARQLRRHGAALETLFVSPQHRAFRGET